MKVAFLTACLAPGKDAVGDYTRALAGACERQGAQTCLVAIHDGWADSPGRPWGRELRLRPGLGAPARVRRVREFFDREQPDVVSVQYGPHAFDRRGLPLSLGGFARQTLRGRVVHTMCHEIWGGGQAGAGRKEQLLGLAQRGLLLHLLRVVDCRRVHTSNVVYQGLLARAGVPAAVLPLFGAIPLPSTPANVATRAGGPLRLVMFGAVHPEWEFSPVLERLAALGRPVSLTHVGRIGPGENLWTELEKCWGDRISVRRLGERPVTRVAEVLAEADLGVVTTPRLLFGKSSVAAAMRDHGLPVIVPRDDLRYPGFESAAPLPEGCIPFDDDFLAQVQTARRRSPRSTVEGIASTFLADLALP